MSMTNKDYELLAATFNATLKAAERKTRVYPATMAAGCRTAGKLDGVLAAISDTADALATDNPRFNRQRFIDACTK